MTTKTITIDGMCCEKCVARVKKALETLDGVSEASVSLEMGKAEVTLCAVISDADLKAAIETKGYDVTDIV